MFSHHCPGKDYRNSLHPEDEQLNVAPRSDNPTHSFGTKGSLTMTPPMRCMEGDTGGDAHRCAWGGLLKCQALEVVEGSLRMFLPVLLHHSLKLPILHRLIAVSDV